MANQHSAMANDLRILMKAALDPNDKNAGLQNMLQSIAIALDAFGCILWEATPDSIVTKAQASGHLFVLSAWFKNGDVVAMHDLRIVDSATGIALRERQPKVIQDIRVNGGSGKEQKFLSRNDLYSMCTVPIEFAENRLAAINVYRRSSQPPFSDEDLQQLKDLADMIPMLYQAIRDKVSDLLIQKIDAILRDNIRPGELSIAKPVLQSICDVIQKTFNCLEVSLFLESSKKRDVVTLCATTWPHVFKKKNYSFRKSEGLTGWVLVEKKIMSIFDLARYRTDKPKLDLQYPGHVWNDSLDLEKSVRDIMKLKPGQDLPPLSFLVLPILVENSVVGVLRCCTFLPGGLYYFSDRDIKLLQIVARQVAHHWNIIKNKKELSDENEWWKQVVTKTNDLNHFVQAEVNRDTPNGISIFQQAVTAAQHLIPIADLTSVRMLNRTRDTFKFDVIGGAAWHAQMKQKFPDIWDRPFKMSDPSIAAHVINTGELYHAPKVQGDANYIEIFPGIVSMMTAPITVGGLAIGVFELRTTSQIPFSNNDRVLCDLLGKQLGLYCHLIENVGRLKLAVKNEKEAQEKQAQMYEDLAHQLKSPVSQALYRAIIACDEKQAERRNLNALRGLCRKARRVALTMGLLRDDTTQKIALDKLDYSRLMKFLVEAAQDAEIMETDPDFPLHFRVKRESFHDLWYSSVRVDFDLLEQAVNNLLDNASKYSFPDSTVSIYGESDHINHRFKVVVANTGLPISPEEAKLCTERGWRGADAKEKTGEGSGIGLWIVKKIMAFHAGEVEIIPTSAESETIVRLAFPIDEGGFR